MGKSLLDKKPHQIPPSSYPQCSALPTLTLSSSIYPKYPNNNHNTNNNHSSSNRTQIHSTRCHKCSRTNYEESLESSSGEPPHNSALVSHQPCWLQHSPSLGQIPLPTCPLPQVSWRVSFEPFLKRVSILPFLTPEGDPSCRSLTRIALSPPDLADSSP